MSSTRSKKSPTAVRRRPAETSTSSRGGSEKRDGTVRRSPIVGGVPIETGSGNVFADLGLPNPETRLLKAKLMLSINDEIGRRGLTQEQAAALVGLAQPDLSRIARGRGAGFSADRLIDVLRRLGRDVEIVISAARPEFGELNIRDEAG